MALNISASIVFFVSVYHIGIPTASSPPIATIAIPNPRLRPYIHNNLIIHENDAVTPAATNDTRTVQEEIANSIIVDTIQFKPQIPQSRKSQISQSRNSTEIEGLHCEACVVDGNVRPRCTRVQPLSTFSKAK
ncbi:unnamed protein product [Lactuca saligna]|uniref:Uncharacterized protein n=1 Tax=Lactuca saligna TaxID=75948 RepID=A0AA35Y7N7_LACSI|nr:unnamed protein product [Lactuca saligna]